VLVVDGFGITARVERHQLVAGGMCEERTEARLSKISGLKRLGLDGPQWSAHPRHGDVAGAVPGLAPTSARSDVHPAQRPSKPD
jgi:hypothetical protein